MSIRTSIVVTRCTIYTTTGGGQNKVAPSKLNHLGHNGYKLPKCL